MSGTMHSGQTVLFQKELTIQTDTAIVASRSSLHISFPQEEKRFIVSCDAVFGHTSSFYLRWGGEGGSQVNGYFDKPGDLGMALQCRRAGKRGSKVHAVVLNHRCGTVHSHVCTAPHTPSVDPTEQGRCIQVPGGGDALAFLADVASKGEEASNDRAKVANTPHVWVGHSQSEMRFALKKIAKLLNHASHKPCSMQTGKSATWCPPALPSP